jgi:hypothetical protein
MSCNKSEIHKTLVSQLEDKLLQAQLDFCLAKESRDSDTKSSAGDKFETGREMMQREMDKLHASIDTYQNQLLKLQTLVGIKSFEIIGVGSLIETNFEKYYISIGLGEITCSSEKVFSISSASPIGELLMGKKLGEYIELRGRKIIIKNIS